MAVDQQHPQYEKIINDYNLVQDVLSEHVESYLIDLNPSDISHEMRTRRQQYTERAVFYNILSATIQGLQGALFYREPSFDAPSELDYLRYNADGSGNSLNQVVFGLANDVLAYGRAGVYVSFPIVPEGRTISAEDVQSGKYSARINRVPPQSIINWATLFRDGVKKLSYVSIHEHSAEFDFESREFTEFERIREMFLDDEGIYNEIHWVKLENDFEIEFEDQPTDARGEFLTSIPFYFVGCENNDSDVDTPPLLGLAKLNIAHYRNSADFEDSVYQCGQAQPYISGLTSSHIKLMTEHGMYWGSKEIIGVPEHGSIGIVQAQPNPLVRQAMLDKLEIMIGLGARLIQPTTQNKTATQAHGERIAQNSLLVRVAHNISDAIHHALELCAQYQTPRPVHPTEYEYHIDNDFGFSELKPEELREIIAGYLKGIVPVNDFISHMKKNQIFDKSTTDEEYSSLLTNQSNINNL